MKASLKQAIATGLGLSGMFGCAHMPEGKRKPDTYTLEVCKQQEGGKAVCSPFMSSMEERPAEFFRWPESRTTKIQGECKDIFWWDIKPSAGDTDFGYLNNALQFSTQKPIEVALENGSTSIRIGDKTIMLQKIKCSFMSVTRTVKVDEKSRHMTLTENARSAPITTSCDGDGDKDWKTPEIRMNSRAAWGVPASFSVEPHASGSGSEPLHCRLQLNPAPAPSSTKI